MTNKRFRLTPSEIDVVMSMRNNNHNPNNTLLIPDLHCPFCHDDALTFCKDMQEKWDCGNIIFMGDILDNHYSSFFASDPDGMNGGEELERALSQIDGFYEAFPEAIVLNGNHDHLPNRVAFKNGLSSKWIKTLDEMLNVPGWTFKDEHWIGNIKLIHGTARVAHTRMKQDLCSIISGHYHSKSYIQYLQGHNSRHFAMQLGCLIDRNAYAFAYSKQFPHQHINVGILLNNELPIIEYMPQIKK